MGIILPGVDGTGRDFPPVFSWDSDGKRLIFVGVGWERFENSLPCNPLLLTLSVVQEWLDTRNATAETHVLHTSVRSGS